MARAPTIPIRRLCSLIESFIPGDEVKSIDCYVSPEQFFKLRPVRHHVFSR
jgi:hypothetical protein